MSGNDSGTGTPWTAAHDLPPLHLDVQRLLDVYAQQTLRAEFRFDLAHPLVVTMSFIVADCPPVTWRLSRDLLYQGLFSLSGLGDVQVWPTHLDDRSAVCLQLDSYGMTASFELPIPPLAEWLEHSYRIVPAGTELEGVDWDIVTAEMLSGGGVPSD
ncbi:SsgA family sporulation/cell division regulator [Streptomyces sp. E5N91]|uniref:SsgA family sporulation/cell division regulator n=1 Tax=Streptomyces sp. E5N91 TaxID=1851996 RepID=UPI00187D5E0E|nr:SsgA family sporulation/cell division regulator [Streptomyces sp. E5N91]